MACNQKGKNKASGSDTTSTGYPGMWQSPSKPKYCCIYRVPERLRRVNPKAYTPQLVLIGPLHHSSKSQAHKSRGHISNTKLMGYLSMEEHKKIYLEKFAQKFTNENIIEELRKKIEEDEEKIRASYSESTAWIESQKFVDMILLDSVFIVEFMLRTSIKERSKIGDPLVDEPCLKVTVNEDLILLENQLPYFIIEHLFGHLIAEVNNKTLREMIITNFNLEGKIGNQEFSHFTDLQRCVYMKTLPTHALGEFKLSKHMYNAEKLHSGGMKFKALEEESYMNVSFENGCLNIPSIWVCDHSEMTLRNIMALEQRHYPYISHVCNYIMFLDFLIDTEKDVDLLVEEGIIKNWIGQPRLVVQMVNKLSLGIITSYGSYYSNIATRVNDHYRDPRKRAWAILKRVYFANLWIGTATIAAMLLLLFNFFQFVTSIFGVVFDSS